MGFQFGENLLLRPCDEVADAPQLQRAASLLQAALVRDAHQREGLRRVPVEINHLREQKRGVASCGPGQLKPHSDTLGVKQC